MPDQARHRVTHATAEVEIRARPAPRLTILRLLRPTDAEIRAASTSLGFELPIAANVLLGARKAARVAPGEWIIFDGPPVGDISAKLGATLHAISNPTPGKAAWTISGARAADLINAGCSLDLHPVAFKPGSVARTLIAGVSALLVRAPDAFDIIADSSLANHISDWLGDAKDGVESW